MAVDKFIRVLGYIVYVILWLPVIVLLLVILPIVWLWVFTRDGLSIKESVNILAYALMVGIKHDMEFIRTGRW